MDLDFITDPNLTPHARDDIRIVSFHVQPYDDQKRVRVEIELTAFTPMDKPNLIISAWAPLGEEVASANIVETMHRSLSITLHLRENMPIQEMRFQADLFFEEGQIQHTVQASVSTDYSAD